MLRPILIHPDARLRKRCDPVDSVGEPECGLIADMLDTMYKAPGIGLAAPQIGVNARLLVMDCTGREDEDEPRRPMALINPEITWQSDEVTEYEEGCLSIPEVFAPVTRPTAVRVAYLDGEGAAREETFEGIWATCVQHEIDHLDGKLFIDYLGPMRRQMITQKMKKLKRELARETGRV